MTPSQELWTVFAAL